MKTKSEKDPDSYTAWIEQVLRLRHAGGLTSNLTDAQSKQAKAFFLNGGEPSDWVANESESTE